VTPYSYDRSSTTLKTSRLVQKYRKDTKREEWALVESEGPIKSAQVLEWFGASKPSKEKVLKAERRVQFFKHR
jgi:hypothetical protein